jgi:hypothetical protein
MKKLIFYSFLAIILFSSCQKEMEAPVFPPAFQWPTGTSDYAPYTIGSSFTYEAKNLSTSVLDSFTYTVIKDTTINNLKYYQLVSDKPSIGPSPTYFANYNNGYLTELTYNMDFLGAITIPELSENTLRVNEPVNATWDEFKELSYSGIPVYVDFEYKVIQKDYTKAVLNNNFANTINVKEVVNISLAGGIPLPIGFPSTIVWDNFYAKGAGLVERNVSIGTTQKLKHFKIVK